MAEFPELPEFIMHYECDRCGESGYRWQTRQDSLCDDRCPHCDQVTEPYKAEEE
jgi:hypothetical protein